MAINFDNVTGNQSSANVLAQINGNFAKINVEEPKWGTCKSVFIESISTLNNLAVGRYFCQQSKAPWEPLATQSSSNIRVFVLEVRQITVDEENIYSYNINYIYGEGAGSQYVSYYEYSETSGEYELQWKLNSGDPLTVATQYSLGGVMPVTKEYTMTQNVGVDSTGKLWTAPGGGGGSTVGAMILKGFLGNNIQILPTSGYEQGWTYIVTEAGNYISGVNCNPFDMVVAKHDYSSVGAQIKSQLDNSSYTVNKSLYENIADKTLTSVNNLHWEDCPILSDYLSYYNNVFVYSDTNNGNKGVIKLVTIDDNETPKFTEDTAYTKVIFNEGNVSDICVGYAPDMRIIGYQIATTEGSTTTYSAHATNLILYDDGEENNPDIKIADLEDYNYTFENWSTIKCIELTPFYFTIGDNSIPINIIINDNKFKLVTVYDNEGVPCAITPIGNDYTWNNTSISNVSINMCVCGEQSISGTWYPTATGIISYNDEANNGYCTFRMVKIAYDEEAETLEDFIINVDIGSPHVLAQNRTKNHNFILGYTSEEEDLILNIYNIYNNSSDVGYITKMVLSYNTDTVISSETNTVTFNAGATTILAVNSASGDYGPYQFYVAYVNKSNRTAKFCGIDAYTLEVNNSPTSETYEYYSPTYPIPSNVNLDNVIYRGSSSDSMASLPSYTYLYKDSSTNHYLRYGICCDDIWFLQSNLSEIPLSYEDYQVFVKEQTVIADYDNTPLIIKARGYNNPAYIQFEGYEDTLGSYGFTNAGVPVIKDSSNVTSVIVTGIATSNSLGGVKPTAKTSTMTQSVGVDSDGALWTTAEVYTLPMANSGTLGGVKAVSKTSSMTQEIGIDSNGKLWTTSGSGNGATVIIFEEDDEQNITCNKTTYQISSAYNAPMFVYLKAYNDYDDTDIYYLTPSTYYQTDGETDGTLSFINYKLNTDNNNISVTNIKMYYDYDIEDDVITKTIKTISLT